MPTVREIEQALFQPGPARGRHGVGQRGPAAGGPGGSRSPRVLVALDITEAVADEAMAQGCQLIVSHHPVMNCKWLPVQTVRRDTPQGHLLLKLLKNDLSAICMHTNLDVAPGGVNDALAAALGLEDPGPLGDPDGLVPDGTLWQVLCLCRSLRSMSAGALEANGVRYAGDGSGPVQKVAVGGGACGDYEDCRHRRRVRHLCHLGSELSPIPGRGREGDQPHRRGPLPHGGPGVRRAGGRTCAEPVPGPHVSQIRLPPGGHPVLRRRRVIDHVRTFQMA